MSIIPHFLQILKYLQKQNDGSWAYGLLYHLITHFPVQFTNISTIPIPNAHWREKLLKLYFLCKEMITSDSWIEEKLQKIVQSVSLCACCGIGVPSKTQLFQTAIILPDSPNAMATQVNCATCNDPKNVKWNLSETEEGVDIEKLTSLIVKEENQYISLLHIEEEWYKVDDSGNFTKLSTDVLQEHLHNTVLIFYKQPVNPPAQSQPQPPVNLIDPPISGNKRFFFEFFKIFLWKFSINWLSFWIFFVIFCRIRVQNQGPSSKKARQNTDNPQSDFCEGNQDSDSPMDYTSDFYDLPWDAGAPIQGTSQRGWILSNKHWRSAQCNQSTEVDNRLHRFQCSQQYIWLNTEIK